MFENNIQHIAWPLAALVGLFMLRGIVKSIVDNLLNISTALKDLSSGKFIEHINTISKLTEKYDEFRKSIQQLEEKILKIKDTVDLTKQAQDIQTKESNESNELVLGSAAEKVAENVKSAWSSFADLFAQKFENIGIIVDKRSIGSTALYYKDKSDKYYIDANIANSISEAHKKFKGNSRADEKMSNSDAASFVKQIQKIQNEFVIKVRF
jgi:hypothetical protein